MYRQHLKTDSTEPSFMDKPVARCFNYSCKGLNLTDLEYPYRYPYLYLSGYESMYLYPWSRTRTRDLLTSRTRTHTHTHGWHLPIPVPMVLDPGKHTHDQIYSTNIAKPICFPLFCLFVC